jgi:hypothetical protein
MSDDYKIKRKDGVFPILLSKKDDDGKDKGGPKQRPRHSGWKQGRRPEDELYPRSGGAGYKWADIEPTSEFVDGVSRWPTRLNDAGYAVGYTGGVGVIWDDTGYVLGAGDTASNTYDLTEGDSPMYVGFESTSYGGPDGGSNGDHWVFDVLGDPGHYETDTLGQRILRWAYYVQGFPAIANELLTAIETRPETNFDYIFNVALSLYQDSEHNQTYFVGTNDYSFNNFYAPNTDPNWSSEACVWTLHPQPAGRKLFPGVPSIAWDINNKLQVVGMVDGTGFIYDLKNDSYRLIPGTRTATRINDNGLVAGCWGEYNFYGGGASGFVWDSTKPTSPLIPITGLEMTEYNPNGPGPLVDPHGINNDGQVVGTYIKSTDPVYGDGHYIQSAFIWDKDNGMVDLNTTVKVTSEHDFVLTGARDINNLGEILAEGYRKPSSAAHSYYQRAYIYRKDKK